MRTTILKRICPLAVGLSLAALVGCSAVAPASTPTPAPTPASAEQVPRITARELKLLLDRGKGVVVVDVRSREAYDAKHIAGAALMPFPEVEQRYQELPKDKDIVLY